MLFFYSDLPGVRRPLLHVAYVAGCTPFHTASMRRYAPSAISRRVKDITCALVEAAKKSSGLSDTGILCSLASHCVPGWLQRKRALGGNR